MWHGAARTESVDFVAGEAKFFKHLFVVLPNFRSSPGRHFSDIVHLDGTADRELQIRSGALDRHNDSVRLQLRIFDDFARCVNDAVCQVTLIENFLPVRDRLRAEYFIQNGREFRRIRRQLCRIGESRVCQQIRAANSIRQSRPPDPE